MLIVDVKKTRDVDGFLMYKVNINMGDSEFYFHTHHWDYDKMVKTLESAKKQPDPPYDRSRPLP